MRAAPRLIGYRLGGTHEHHQPTGIPAVTTSAAASSAAPELAETPQDPHRARVRFRSPGSPDHRHRRRERALGHQGEQSRNHRRSARDIGPGDAHAHAFPDSEPVRAGRALSTRSPTAAATS